MRVGIVGLAAAGAATYYQTGKLNIWGDLPPTARLAAAWRRCASGGRRSKC